MDASRFTVLGPLMGGKGSQAFLGCVQDDRPRAGKGQVRPVVMVFLPDAVVQDADLLSQVIDETKVASEIDHVNVIGVWGVTKLDEGTARVVEFADAESLATVYERLREHERTLPVAIATAIVKDACMGAHYAHELGRMETGAPLIHGGIRPGTLLVSFQGMAKVTGYGAATLAEFLRKERGEEAAIRDPYTAPEQIFGGRSAATEQTDVYGLGAVLFEALTGKPPIDEGAGLSDALIRDDVTPDMLPGVDPRLQDIVVKAMRRKATDRYPSALDMRHALLDTGLCANDAEARSFMEDLFPPDYPTRVARMSLLASARGKRETTKPAPFKNPVGGSEDTNAGRPSPVSGVDQPPLGDEPDGGPSIGAPWGGAPVEPPPAPAVAAPPAARPPPSPLPAPHPAATTPATPYPAPSYPYPPAPVAPQVVYRTPPWVPIMVAVVVGAAVALGAVLFLRPDPPPVVVAAPVVPTPPPVAAPVDPPPPPTPPDDNAQQQPNRQPDRQPDRQPEKNPKPRARPAPPKNGTLTISSDPPAAIYVDGKKIGVGNATTEVKAGKHKVQVKDPKKGISLHQTVRVKGGENKSLSFEVGRGKLLLTAPAGSLVYLDGNKIGTAPLEPYSVFEGSHTVTVKKDVGGPEFSRSFRVRPGDEVSVWVEFRTTPQ